MILSNSWSSKGKMTPRTSPHAQPRLRRKAAMAMHARASLRVACAALGLWVSVAGPPGADLKRTKPPAPWEEELPLKLGPATPRTSIPSASVNTPVASAAADAIPCNAFTAGAAPGTEAAPGAAPKHGTGASTTTIAAGASSTGSASAGPSVGPSSPGSAASGASTSGASRGVSACGAGESSSTGAT